MCTTAEYINNKREDIDIINSVKMNLPTSQGEDESLVNAESIVQQMY